MSLEIAKKVYIELTSGDSGKRIAFEDDPEAFLKVNAFECTVDEIKEVMTMDRKLDDKELLMANGGFSCWTPPADGDGHCWTNFFMDSCANTVKKGDWCWGELDFCCSNTKNYLFEGGTAPKTRSQPKPADWD